MLLIIDGLGFVPFSKISALLLPEVTSQRYEQGSILVTTSLPFNEWTEVFGAERLTGVLLDRTHHVRIRQMNGESYRLKRSRQASAQASTEDSSGTQTSPQSLPPPAPAETRPTVTYSLNAKTSVNHFCSATLVCFVAALDTASTRNCRKFGNIFR